MDIDTKNFLNTQNKPKSNTDTIYFDYENIVSSEKLHQFLFDYFYKYKRVTWIKDNEEELFCQGLQSTINKYNKHRLLVGFLDKFFLKWYSPKSSLGNSGQDLPAQAGKKKILFRLFKYYDIILGAKKYHQVGLIVHARDRLFAIKNLMGYIITSDLDQHVLAYLQEKNIKYLYRLIKEVENKLGAVKPNYIVLWNDIFPIERAIVLASKKLGITTLEIQHGVYDSFRTMETGKVVDHVLVWGEYFKDLYVKQGKRKPEDIYVLGYPYVIPKNQDVENKDSHYVVCYLGQDLEIYDKNFLSIKFETANSIYKICKKLGLAFVYRPHPGDDRKALEEKLPHIYFTPAQEKLEETFKKADIFISFQSTSLVEAAMRSKISLQLLNYPLKSDNFEKLSACNASLQTLEELENYLKKIVSAKKLDELKIEFNNNYVETRYNPVERFLEIIHEIEKSKE